MKKLLTTLMLAMLFLISKAQPVLYGLTSNGGSNGTISVYEAGANALNASFNFPDIGSRPQGSLLQASDGKFYGMTQGGGTSSLGTFFSFDPVLSVHTKLFDFNGANGSFPQGSVIQANDGKLYGMTTYGGANNLGVIFSFDLATSVYTKLKDFDEPSGNRPGGSLLQARDGKLYGLTYTGGVVGISSYGTLFSLDPATNVYAKLKVFDFINGAYPVNSLIQLKDGKLYGMTAGGGTIAGLRLGYGVIFSFDPLSSVYTKLKDFDGVNGANPSGDLLLANDGKLYGMTPTGAQANGSVGNYDVLFSFDPATSVYTNLRNFTGPDGDSPYGSLMQASDGNLYGMTTFGGSNGAGVVFSFNPATAAYSKLQDFNGSNGRNPFYGALVEIRTITTTVINTNYCAGAALPVAYTAKGVYKPGVTFTAQLSDPAGSFTNPVNIGSISSVTSGTINAVLPATAADGVAYRIRVVANFPATTGADNGSNITINALPALALAPYGDVCVSDPPFTLTGGAPAGGEYSGKGVTNNQFDPAAVGVGIFTITYTFKNNAGCTAAIKQSISVVKPCVACKASITAGGPTTFCQGEKVTLTASNGSRYLWSNGATTQQITVGATGSYSVKVTDANKCTAVSMPLAVTVNALPATPVITPGGSTVFCIPASVTLAAGTADAYLWSNGATKQSITVTSSGTYTIAVTNAAGCSAVSSGIAVTAMKCILYCATQGNSDKKGYIQKVVTTNGINNNSGWNNGYGNFTNIAGSSSLKGIFDMVISPGFTGSSNKLYTKVWIDWNQNGDFNDAGDLVFAPANASDLDRTSTVTIPATAATGYTTMRIIMNADAATSWCGSFKYGEAEDYTILISSSGSRIASAPAPGYIDKIAEVDDLRVFPNPVAGRLQIQRSANNILLPAGSNALLQLTDAGGQILIQTKLSGNQQYLDVSRFSNGIYFLHIKTSNTSTVKKIFIQH